MTFKVINKDKSGHDSAVYTLSDGETKVKLEANAFNDQLTVVDDGGLSKGNLRIAKHLLRVYRGDIK